MQVSDLQTSSCPMVGRCSRKCIGSLRGLPLFLVLLMQKQVFCILVWVFPESTQAQAHDTSLLGYLGTMCGNSSLDGLACHTKTLGTTGRRCRRAGLVDHLN